MDAIQFMLSTLLGALAGAVIALTLAGAVFGYHALVKDMPRTFFGAISIGVLCGLAATMFILGGTNA
jgi:hypothetical protein